MTTASWSTPVDHTSDAGFRVWGLELAAKFAAVGMVQQSDTGQINWTTVTRPGTNNAAAGYEIWKTPGGGFTLKIQYGNGSGTTIPSLQMSAGTGSNGSGTLTGQVSTNQFCHSNGITTSTGTNFQSFLCAVGDYVGLSWKNVIAGTTNGAENFFLLAPTVDSTGAPTTTGFYVLFGGRNVSTGGANFAALQTVRTLATAATRSITSAFCLVPGIPLTSSDGSNNQLYLHWLDTPAVQPARHSASIRLVEAVLGTTFTSTLIGTTSHTYISCFVGNGSGNQIYFDQNGATCCAMLWE